MSTRFIILDPGFEHFDSHHEVVNRLITEARPSDSEVLIVAGSMYRDEDAIGESKVVSLFETNLYPHGYSDLGNDVYRTTVASFLEDLDKFNKIVGLRPGDTIIIHTAFSFFYEAVARFLYASNFTGITLYISTMFSCGRTVEFGQLKTLSMRELMRHKFSFSVFELLEAHSDYGFVVESPTQFYADAYGSFLQNQNVSVHASVCGGKRVKSPNRNKKVLAYLGGPKWEKGIEFTVDAIVRLSQNYPDFEYIFHFNDNFSGSADYKPLIESMVGRENIHIIYGNLDKDRYESLLAEADIYLLLYDPKTYSVKTSGVLWDVLRHAEGKAVIVSRDTWHQKELTLLGANFHSVEYGDVDRLAQIFDRNVLTPITSRTYNNEYSRVLLGNFGLGIFDRLSNHAKQHSQNTNSMAGKSILVVRTDYGHFSDLSGPGGFVKYLDEMGMTVEDVRVPLGHESPDFSDKGIIWRTHEFASQYLSSYQVNAFEVESHILENHHKYDVIHFVDGEHAGLFTALARLKRVIPQGTKLVATFHQPDFVIKDLIKSPEFLSAFDNIHLMSPCQRRPFIELGIHEDRIKVIPHGVAEEHFSVALNFSNKDRPESNAEIYRLQERFSYRRIILIVGNWLRDFETFLSVARDFANMDDVLFVVVSRGLSLPLVGSDNNVLLMSDGVSDQTLHWLYRRCECLFLPLQGGAANNAILEALASNTAILTSDLPSTRFYTNDNALFFKDAKDASAKLRLLLNQQVAYAHQGAEDLKWQNIATRMCMELY